MTWYRRLVALLRFAGKYEGLTARVSGLECETFRDQMRIADLEHAYLDERARAAAREALLREEIEQWKSHRAWSDQIVRAYLDEIARKTAVLQ